MNENKKQITPKMADAVARLMRALNDKQNVRLERGEEVLKLSVCVVEADAVEKIIDYFEEECK